MTVGLGKISELKEAAKSVDVRPISEGYGDLAHALDLRASLVTAEATILGAVERRESRGAHNRLDHPEIEPELKVNFIITRDEDELAITSEPVQPVPEHLQGWAADDEDIDVAGRLLE